MAPDSSDDELQERESMFQRWSVLPIKRRVLMILLFVVAISGTYTVLLKSGALGQLQEADSLKEAALQLGSAGPILIIALMALAVVMSPVPSAPIALAAGAAYGHYWGTAYVAVGSLAGALVAFGISRYLGYGLVRSWFGSNLSPGIFSRFLNSQNGLMLAVFATRLMPFVSFDVISYAAGLTPLAVWRFVLATLLGIIPASFVLAHFGDELASADPTKAALTVLALGAVTLLPVAWKFLSSRFGSPIGRNTRHN